MRELEIEEIDAVAGGSPQGCIAAIGWMGITAAGFEFGPLDWVGFGFASFAMYDSCSAP